MREVDERNGGEVRGMEKGEKGEKWVVERDQGGREAQLEERNERDGWACDLEMLEGKETWRWMRSGSVDAGERYEIKEWATWPCYLAMLSGHALAFPL